MIMCSLISLMMRLLHSWFKLVLRSLLLLNITRQQHLSYSNSLEGRNVIQVLRCSSCFSLRTSNGKALPFHTISVACLFSKLLNSDSHSRFIPEYCPSLPTADVPNSSDDDGTPFRQSQPSQPVPDSPCSVNSDGSGSWIGIPRWGS